MKNVDNTALLSDDGMSPSLEYVKTSLQGMAMDKLNNMYGCEISPEVFDFLEGKENILAESAYKLFEENAVVNTREYLTALEGYAYNLAFDYAPFDESSETEMYQFLKHSSDDIKLDVFWTMLYNYDALWMTAIQKAFPGKVTDTQCGYGCIELIA